MHEQSLINNLIRKILLLAENEQAKKVTKVSIRLGALSHMSPEHFKEHFDIASKGTIAEQAELDAEVSEDIHDSNAPYILLKSIDISP